MAVEAGVTQGWYRFVGDGGAVDGMDRFGASASGDIVLAGCGFTVEELARVALVVVEQHR